MLRMTFEAYEKSAARFRIYPESFALTYPVLGLCSEAGELAGKIKRIYRNGPDDKVSLYDIVSELGDILWYIAAIAGDLGVPLDEVAKRNIEKLNDRAERGRLTGSGDTR